MSVSSIVRFSTLSKHRTTSAQNVMKTAAGAAPTFSWAECWHYVLILLSRRSSNALVTFRVKCVEPHTEHTSQICWAMLASQVSRSFCGTSAMSTEESHFVLVLTNLNGFSLCLKLKRSSPTQNSLKVDASWKKYLNQLLKPILRIFLMEKYFCCISFLPFVGETENP